MGVERIEAAFQGALLGTCVGDALGLPFEGMSRRRVRKMLGDRPLAHRFVLGRGMVSDDTDHACLVAMSLAEAGGSPEEFARLLARRLRWWLLTLPAGIGFGTLRGLLKLWVGFSPARSGVRSAGNGPAMRAPLIGVAAREDWALRRELVRASTRITHTDPRAEQGAIAIASAAAAAVNGALASGAPEGAFRPLDILSSVQSEVDEPELSSRLDLVARSLDSPTDEVVRAWGQERGISGFILDTVPAVLHCWLRNHGEASLVLPEIIRCGGDTDTTGAIAGALCGAARGVASIPREWVDGIVEWPRSVAWMRALGSALARNEPAPRYFAPGLLLRNMVFLAVVYGQIVRRALPPY